MGHQQAEPIIMDPGGCAPADPLSPSLAGAPRIPAPCHLVARRLRASLAGRRVRASSRDSGLEEPCREPIIDVERG